MPPRAGRGSLAPLTGDEGPAGRPRVWVAAPSAGLDRRDAGRGELSRRSIGPEGESRPARVNPTTGVVRFGEVTGG